MHPGNRILIYILTALVIPGLSFFLALFSLAGALATIAWMGRTPWRLIWRTRLLFLVLVLGYAYSLPGEPLWLAMGEWGPTVAGLARGMAHAVVLMSLLLWLDVLVLSLPPPALLVGLELLLRPLGWLGVNVDRFALRLALTLRVIELLEHRRVVSKGPGPLARFFEPVDISLVPEEINIQIRPFLALDYLVMALSLVGAGGWLIGGGIGHG